MCCSTDDAPRSFQRSKYISMKMSCTSCSLKDMFFIWNKYLVNGRKKWKNFDWLLEGIGQCVQVGASLLLLSGAVLFCLTTRQLSKAWRERMSSELMHFWTRFKFVPLLAGRSFKKGQMPNWKRVRAKSKSYKLRKNLFNSYIMSLAFKSVLFCISQMSVPWVRHSGMHVLSSNLPRGLLN